MTNPHARLMELCTASAIAKVVYTAAKIGLTDQLAGGAKTAAEIAGPLGAHAPSLYRVMRTLASLGFLTETSERFALTPLGELLQTGSPFRSAVLTLCGPLMSQPFDDFEHSVRTGETAFEKVFGAPIFDHLAQRPEAARQFSETMVAFHGAEPPAVAAAYDFSGLQTIVDVGGATGNLLQAILAQHAGPRGVLFDLPHVVADAPKHPRITTASGSFFESIPTGGDAYVLSHIIHDWTEAQCLTILGNCRKAMSPNARLLIVESVLPAGDVFHPGKVLDMVMLAIPGGVERSEAEYAALLAKAGFRLARVVPTASAVSVIEAVPA